MNTYTNLRLLDGMLRPVGTIRRHLLPPGATVLARMGTEILYCKGGAVATTASAATADVGAEPLCACALDETDTLLMTTDGAVRISLVGNALSATPVRRGYPAATMRASAASPLSADVAARRLSSALGTSPLKSADINALAGDLRDAYRRLCRLASSARNAIQPALGRYHLYDAGGKLLFTSPPVLLTAASGTQCDSSVALLSDDGTTAKGYTLSADTWSLQLDLPVATATDDVARLDVMLSPLFHPYDTSMEADVEQCHRATAADPFARISLPGRSRSLSGLYGGNARRILADAIARMDALERRVASVHHPFGATAQSMRIEISASPDPQTDTRAIAAALQKPVVPCSRLSSLLMAPNTFSARRVGSGASAVAWSGLTVHRYRGHEPQIFAAGARTDSPWRAVAAVRFRGGKGMVLTASGDSGGFTSLGPVLSYPAPDAEELIISIHSGGVTYGRSFALVPDASGRRSIYIEPSLRNIALPPTSAAQIVDFAPADEALPGIVAFAPAHSPLDIRTATDVGEAPVAILARASTGQAWDFGRARFMVSTPSRLIAITLNAAMDTVALHGIHASGLRRPDAITTDGAGGFYAVLAGKIIHISTSGKVRPFDSDATYTAVGFDMVFGELWALRADGKLRIFANGLTGRYLRDDCHPTAFADCGGLMAWEGTSVALPGIETRAADIHVAANEVIVPATFRPAQVNVVHADMQTSKINGSIAIAARSVGPLRAWPLRTATISGACAGPLRIALPARRIRALECRLDATVDAAFTFAGFSWRNQKSTV